MSAAAASDTVLQVEDVTLQYKTRDHIVTATYDVSFEVHRGDRFVLLGPSGCGKSSLLKAVGGFHAPRDGTIKLDGQPVRKPGPDRMMVFQEFDQLLSWKTIGDNVAYPMQVTRRFPASEIKPRCEQWLKRAHLSKFGSVYPHMLSGGMKQRAAIARAMAMEPKMLLMDEPFAALDALTRRSMQEELLRLWEETRLTMLFVTHSIEEAIVIGSRVLVLSPHPGRVRAEIGVGHIGFKDVGSPEFRDMHDRIHDLLFKTEEAHD
ncbi:ABC transporter ATP-binding protein [Bradyrhizobium sp. NAS80.1]|uniref:ABC transporter ATP-binding protein n=1 Tax=Bradyrhizobium sp. NAS80.1 TaxID=1680159 RepID=UPI001FD8E93A|nr:ABC transporter ATP-binding protein [Bradyrhizobium sp. NAS80.1]